MLVLGVNRILHWVQITTGWGKYTCPTKEISGELFFKFKNEWHSVAQFASEHTQELILEGGRIFSRPFRK